MAKIERETLLHFTHESKMKDVGTYKRSFRIFRRNPKLDMQFVTTKSALTGGIAPLTRAEMLLVDTIAALTVYFEPVDDKGNKVSDPNWIEEILDQDILFGLHEKWLDYQASFYPAEGKSDAKGDAETPVQG